MTSQKHQGRSSMALDDELGLADLPEEKRQQLKAKMTEIILKRIFLETMYRLSGSEQASYEKMIDGGSSPEEVEKFLREKIDGYDSMVRRIIEDFEEKVKSLA